MDHTILLYVDNVLGYYGRIQHIKNKEIVSLLHQNNYNVSHILIASNVIILNDNFAFHLIKSGEFYHKRILHTLRKSPDMRKKIREIEIKNFINL